MRISDWSSDVCSSDLGAGDQRRPQPAGAADDGRGGPADVEAGKDGDRRLAAAGAAAGRMAHAVAFTFLNSFRDRRSFFPGGRLHHSILVTWREGQIAFSFLGGTTPA